MCQKKPFLKRITLVYDDVGRRSIYRTIQLFIRSKMNTQSLFYTYSIPGILYPASSLRFARSLNSCCSSWSVDFITAGYRCLLGNVLVSKLLKSETRCRFTWTFTALQVMQTRYSDENYVRLSVCPFVTRVHCDKTEERSV